MSATEFVVSLNPEQAALLESASGEIRELGEHAAAIERKLATITNPDGTLKAKAIGDEAVAAMMPHLSAALDGVSAGIARTGDKLMARLAELDERVTAMASGTVGDEIAEDYGPTLRAHDDRMQSLERKLTGYVQQLNEYRDLVRQQFSERQESVDRYTRITTQRWADCVARLAAAEGHLADVREGLDPEITAPLGAVVQGLLTAIRVHGERLDRREAEQRDIVAWQDKHGERLANHRRSNDAEFAVFHKWCSNVEQEIAKLKEVEHLTLNPQSVNINITTPPLAFPTLEYDAQSDNCTADESCDECESAPALDLTGMRIYPESFADAINRHGEDATIHTTMAGDGKPIADQGIEASHSFNETDGHIHIKGPSGWAMDRLWGVITGYLDADDLPY